LGGGLMPISAMLTQQDIFDRAYGRNFYVGESHNSTFSYNGLSCVAALATLDQITDELIFNVGERGAAFMARLNEELSGNPYFEEARGAGFMLGVKLRQPDHPWLSFEYFGWPELNDHPSIGPLLCYRLYKRGFIAYCCGHDWSILRLQPRFNIETEKLNAFARIIREELDQLCKLA